MQAKKSFKAQLNAAGGDVVAIAKAAAGPAFYRQRVGLLRGEPNDSIKSVEDCSLNKRQADVSNTGDSLVSYTKGVSSIDRPNCSGSKPVSKITAGVDPGHRLYHRFGRWFVQRGEQSLQHHQPLENHGLHL